MSRRTDEFWKNVDWSKGPSHLSRELGVSRGTVTRARDRIVGAPPDMRSRAAWRKVDWSKTSIELAKELGVSVVTVSKRRNRHAPKTVGRHLMVRPTIPKEWRKVDWSKSMAQLAREKGVLRRVVVRYRNLLREEEQRKTSR